MKSIALRATALLVLLAATRVDAREVGFEDRLAAQRAIEQVYWNHRIWPHENQGPKPPLSAVMPESAIRAKVESALRMSMLLDSFWHQPLTGDQVQAEIDRMARESKAPDTLRDLFAALGNDPLLIAECLARPTLAQRRVEAAFSRDERIHGAQREALEAKLSGVVDLDGLAHVEGDHAEVTFVLEGDGRVGAGEAGRASILLHRDEWDREVARLASSLGAVAVDGGSDLPVGRVSRLLDRGDRFVAMALTAKSANSITVATVTWPKRAYAAWSREVSPAVLDARPLAPPVQGYAAPALPAAPCTNDTWTPTAGTGVLDERYRHTAVWTGSEMIVWGGLGGGNTGGRYNPATDTWTSSSLATGSGANVPTARYDHTAVWTGSEMIVWGGGFPPTATGGRYSPLTDTWAVCSLTTGTGANVPAWRYKHTAVWTGAEMIVWGGRSIYPGPVGDLNGGGRYNPSTDTWAASSLTTGSGANVPAARSEHTAIWTGSEMIVWGGVANPSGIVTPLNTGGRYNPSTDTWAPSSLTAGTGADVPDARTGHTAIWTGSEMIVWGGIYATTLATGGRYDPVADAWIPTSLTTGSGPNVPSARSGHTAVWTGTEMIVWGGLDLGGYAATGGRFVPASDAWAATSLGTGGGANAIQARAYHTAVWTGSEMIVWGGLGSAGPMNTGGRFVASTDSWAASTLNTGSDPNLPLGRYGHTAVWTGSEMIVWGGVGDGLYQTGGRYDPSTDSWAASSLRAGSGANVPAARTAHTATWTGSEMIVWGGMGYGGYLNTGGRYAPATDAWSVSSLADGSGANVPKPRDGHTAVWTGTEMIVWGGGPPPTSTGGRYNPVTDTWSLTSLTDGSGANVPTPRDHHSAVWTGSEMIVWGGYDGGSFNTGGRYNPVADSWASSILTTGAGANVPPGRVDHTAVWTGSEMIVWGGSGFTGRQNTGGRFRPSTDSWAASSLTAGSGTNVPTARTGHTAVWTGFEMIVWGGEDGSGSAGVNTGGRYEPSVDTWSASTLSSGSGANVPWARMLQTAVWTGSPDHRMIVWGGYPPTHSGGLYCAQCILQTWYHDADGDGHGDPADAKSSCAQPAGHVLIGDDCNDASSAIHPGGIDVCNGLDDDCSGVADDGANATCDDADACTADVCRGSSGCAHTDIAATCDDGDVCTADACDALAGCIATTTNLDTESFSTDRIDGRDLFVLAASWNSCPGDARYDTAANLDQVGTLPGACVGMTDFHLFMQSFGRSCP